MESHLSSAAAFVEGGIQDACDDSCSICLEDFTEQDPSTVTCCRHAFHLQCILEWCQRSSHCPMCWQAISLKDPSSQELLEGVERERSIRVNRPRNTTIFHHPTLGDFELQHLPVGTNEAELEERIIQHLAAAAAMGRAHHIARREGQRGRSTSQGRAQFLVLSTSPNTSSVGSLPASAQRGEHESVTAGTSANPSVPLALTEETPHQASHIVVGQADRVVTLPSRDNAISAGRPALSISRSFAGQSSINNEDGGGPSDFHSFSESLKSRLNAVSTRYKDSISRSTRGWKERLFSRNSSMSELGSDVRREVNAGIATVSRMVERLDMRENMRAPDVSGPQSFQGHAALNTSNRRVTESHANTLPSNSNISASAGPT
ncbi:E3 ubiquitin-protein ligase RHF2A-like [Iris pallida]|uniref:RING-type E3 ubiquitin transferase n=1 Tax=Iris pallida TaxID=29817 RepID=A0AAX6DXN1_IRIPA|nr:E3 ubiquitin-protein ligase RHF2A-like [Iris pallida]